MPTSDRPTPTDDIEERDPGLARERTDLAWTRTAISFVALGTAMLHTNTIAAALVIAAGAAIWLMGHLCARSARRADHPERRSTVRLITAATTLMAIVALTLALLAPGYGHR